MRASAAGSTALRSAASCVINQSVRSKAAVPQPSHECGCPLLHRWLRKRSEKANGRQLNRPLRSRRERPCSSAAPPVSARNSRRLMDRSQVETYGTFPSTDIICAHQRLYRSALSEKQRGRLVHPLSNLRRWRAATAHNGPCPADLRRDAVAAWRRFRASLQALLAEQARSLWQVALNEAMSHA